jgi:hypothetical protein
LTRRFANKISPERCYGADGKLLDGITLPPVMEWGNDEECESDGDEQSEADERVKQGKAWAW